MAFYDFYMQAVSNPKQAWKEGFQALVDDQFENASTVQFDVEEEDSFGTLKFHPIECRINSLVDAKTGQRVNDDYKKIIFPDLDKAPDLGTRYRFDNNIWIVFSTDNIKTDTSSAYLRRCNNVLTIEDKYGVIHHEPCYIDYKVTETQLFKEYTMDVPSGRIQVSFQLNEHTDGVKIANRYIFDGGVYKVRELNKFDRQYTFQKHSASLIFCYMDVDEINPADRFDINVADYFIPAYRVEGHDVAEGFVGTSGKIDYTVYFIDKITDEAVYFESSDRNICLINQYNGEYHLLNKGSCTITIRMFNNPDIYTVISVTAIEDTGDNSVLDRVTPDVNYIRLNETLAWDIYSYVNNKRTDDKFEIKAYDVPTYCFDLYTTENSFSIHYKQLYDGVLRIVCTNLNTNTDTMFFIELGGVW